MKKIMELNKVMKDKIILDLCGGTGSWSKPYKDAGYDVKLITLPKYDIRDFYLKPDDKIYGIFAAPPCTMFSRARTTAKTPRDFKGAMEVVSACLRIIWEAQYENRFYLKFWALENPAGHLQRFLGKPAFKFHPYDFGDRHSKQTFIWGMFNEPKKSPIQLNEQELLASRNNTRKLPPIPKDYQPDGKMKPVQIRRSITPPGFANAFFRANP
jgi:hypothetical protein